MRKFDGDQLVIATHNKGKLEEIGDNLSVITADLRSFSADVKEGKGVLGRIVRMESDDQIEGAQVYLLHPVHDPRDSDQLSLLDRLLSQVPAHVARKMGVAGVDDCRVVTVLV